MMTVKELARQYDYGYWANKRIFAVLAHLTPKNSLVRWQAVLARSGTRWFMS